MGSLSLLDPRIECLALTLWSSTSWSTALEAGGEVERASRLYGAADESLPACRVGRDLEFYAFNFGRFISSERAIAYARSIGYRPAHPRAVTAASQRFYELPHLFKHPAPMSLATLLPCYTDDGEPFVLSVQWDKKLARTVRGVYFNYGWEPEYWFLFEVAPAKKAR